MNEDVSEGKFRFRCGMSRSAERMDDITFQRDRRSLSHIDDVSCVL